MMNIVLAGDLKALPGLELVIYSTMFHAHEPITWHVFTMDIEIKNPNTGECFSFLGLRREDADWLTKVVKFLDSQSELIVYDCKEKYLEWLDNSPNRYNGFTPYAALRLLVDQMLPETLERCLYFDADLIIQEDIGDMYWKYTSQDADYAAYILPGATEGFGDMISAVIAFNLARIRWTGFLNRARHNYTHKMYRFPDQGALEEAGKPFPLPETYNYMHDHKDATYRPAILHFSNDNKLKIYQSTQGDFYRYYPEHRWLKEGLDAIRDAWHICKIGK